MKRQLSHLLLAFGLVAAVGAPAAAQATDASAPPATANNGWTLTPSLLADTMFDDNALVRNSVSDTPSDFVNVVNPRIAAEFKGRRGEFTGNYDGAFRLYRSLSSLNSYDQQAAASARRMIAPHVTLFSGYQMFTAPTTELLELVGVPYVRTGSTSNTIYGGVDSALSKHLTLSASYNFQVVDFQQTVPFNPNLVGGHSHSARATVKRAISPRLSLTGNYGLEVATVGQVADAFEIHSAEGGVEYRVSDHLRVFGSGGFAHLAVNVVSAARTGPSLHAGVARDFQKGTVAAGYSRSFVPSYGFGGTQQNEELTGRVHVPLSQFVYAQSSLAWRRNEPLVLGGPKLRTIFVEASVGYRLAPWASIEGFYDSASQEIAGPGGQVDRRRIGAQIITTKPMRIR
jgi:hypothetical protein